MTTALALTSDTSLDRYMAEVNRYPLLSREEEHELALRLYDHGDVRAAHELVVSNLRFVVKIAHEYRGYGLKLLDMVQEGNVGLMVAVRKFNPYKGYRLISYAVWWIRAYIQSFIQRSWSMVKLGTSRVQRKLFFKLRSEKARAERELGPGEGVSTEVLAERLGANERDVARMEVQLAGRDFSLDANVGEDGSPSHLDMVADETANQEELLGDLEERRLLEGKVEEALDSLNEKERYIVEHRLLADEPETLQEIGDSFKVSRERIRQLENRVIGKLRTSLKAAMSPGHKGVAVLDAHG